MKIKTYTVTSLTEYIARVIENDILLNTIVVEGEISAFKKYPSGHAYFTLKDNNSRLSCVMFRFNAKGIDKVDDGTKVRLIGKLSVYQKEGRYQLIASDLHFIGQGELYEKFLALKKKLQAAGYFEESLKKPLPIVKKVGLITSPRGAAIGDFCSILKRRDPLIEIDFFPTNVQGEMAVQGIIKALNYFNREKNVDLVVLTRGGGSKEDLWTFNDEELARAIIEFDLPLVSAVGHEIDVTISDYLADLRVPTPSAAAEIISTDRYQTLANLKQDLKQMNISIKQDIKRLENKLAINEPLTMLKRQQYNNKELIFKLDAIYDSIDRRMKQDLTTNKQTLDNLWQLIESKHPNKQLERGFVYTKDSNGQIIKSAKQLSKGDSISIYYLDGKLETEVKGVEIEDR